MKVLILSANTGGGHNSAAAAVLEAFERREISCEVRDALAFISEFHSEVISTGHIYLYRYLPKLFGLGYRYEEQHQPKLIYEQMAMGARKFARFVNRNEYDVIISTHIFGSMMVTEARRWYGLSVPHYLIVTDYSYYPGTDMVDVDRYFVGAEDLNPLYIASGIDKGRLTASGIPIQSKFLTPLDKVQARRELHLHENGPVILLFSGSIGCGHLTKVVPQLEAILPEDAKLVVICGNNKRLANRLREHCGARCRVIGYTKRVADYMAAADLCISKPGGLSTTEMLAMQLPMVLMLSVPGCETHNLNYFVHHGVAIGSEEWPKAIQSCAELICNPDKLERMRCRYATMEYPGGAEVIVQTVIDDYVKQ
ncbi:MAG: glycosyltransferase [Clostridia bacterium]|nr:glycosyltransferase [Clostridia bacterium]